ncbi:hypothetical protein CTheo_7768 [Ceratobasidium theobromae]|uniref:Uncharacterized protein n=1 Tax=Ceratobasidium theobromae TaxID=1582974 RepID=A0A5N5QAX3_9AGAM|nr:hypothetical protein CTheo_7768 [Ceratobasidium theobromae]
MWPTASLPSGIAGSAPMARSGAAMIPTTAALGEETAVAVAGAVRLATIVSPMSGEKLGAALMAKRVTTRRQGLPVRLKHGQPQKSNEATNGSQILS